MSRSTVVSAVAGLLAGFVLASMIFALARSRHVPESASRPPAQDTSAAVQRLEEEKRLLSERIAALEKSGTAPEKKPESPPAAPAVETEPKPDLKAKFLALAEKGINAFAGADYMELLGHIRKSGREGLELLTQALLKGATSQERFMAAALMEGLGDPAAIPALAEALKADSDDLVRRMASHALALIGTEAAEPALRVAMTADKDWGVRVNSAYGVAKLGREDGVRILEQSYGSPDTPSEYRLAILGGLADVAPASSAPLFRKILSDTKDMTYLLLAITSLGKMKDAGSRPDLERVAASSDLPAYVREAAQRAITQLGN